MNGVEFETLVCAFLNTHRRKGPLDVCLFCGSEEIEGNPILPFGTRRAGHSWVHYRCWPAWYERRRQIVIERLRKEHANETLAAAEPDKTYRFPQRETASQAPVGSEVLKRLEPA